MGVVEGLSLEVGRMEGRRYSMGVGDGRFVDGRFVDGRDVARWERGYSSERKAVRWEERLFDGKHDCSMGVVTEDDIHKDPQLHRISIALN